MPANRRDSTSESTASVASLQEFVKGFQSQQLKTIAVNGSPWIISAAIRKFTGRR